jgi:hypothetical protein
MKSLLSALFITVGMLTFTAAATDDRPDHFKGKQADTLEQAVANFTEYNAKLKTLLSTELTPQAMAEIHQLTYTLEVALEKIHNETGKLKDTLEQVHIASERMDTVTAKQSGDSYIKTAEALVK